MIYKEGDKVIIVTPDSCYYGLQGEIYMLAEGIAIDNIQVSFPVKNSVMLELAWYNEKEIILAFSKKGALFNVKRLYV